MTSAVRTQRSGTFGPVAYDPPLDVVSANDISKHLDECSAWAVRLHQRARSEDALAGMLVRADAQAGFTAPQIHRARASRIWVDFELIAAQSRFGLRRQGVPAVRCGSSADHATYGYYLTLDDGSLVSGLNGNRIPEKATTADMVGDLVNILWICGVAGIEPRPVAPWAQE